MHSARKPARILSDDEYSALKKRLISPTSSTKMGTSAKNSRMRSKEVLESSVNFGGSFTSQNGNLFERKGRQNRGSSGFKKAHRRQVMSDISKAINIATSKELPGGAKAVQDLLTPRQGEDGNTSARQL